MAEQAPIDLVKINTSGVSSVSFTDEQIGALLDAHGSVAYVSYKICLQKSSNDAVTLGPISLKSNADYWKNLAQLYWNEYQLEQQDNAQKAGSGSTIFMQRADGT